MSYCPCCGCMSCNYERQRIDKEIKDAGGPAKYLHAGLEKLRAKFSVLSAAQRVAERAEPRTVLDYDVTGNPIYATEDEELVLRTWK